MRFHSVRVLTCCLAGAVAPLFAADEPVPPAVPAPAKETPKEEAKEAPKPPADPSILAELGDIKIPIASILQLEKDWVANNQAQEPGFTLSAEDRPKLRKGLAMKEIEMILLVRYVKEHQLTASKEEVDTWLANFKKDLASQGNTYEKFLESIRKTDAEFRSLSESIHAMEKKLGAEVTDEEIKAEVKKASEVLPLRRCSHILYMYKGGQRSEATRSKEEAKQLAVDALEKLKKGDDFAKLAKATSDCPSKEQGGDLDFSALKGGMVPAFAEALYKIEKVGDLSGVVETEFGYHIIKLTELNKADSVVKERLTRGKFDKFMQQVRAENLEKVKFNEQLLNAAAPAAANPSPTPEKAK